MSHMIVTVRITTQRGTSSEHDLSEGDSIGRSSDNTAVVDDETVSGLHARIRVTGGAVSLVDQGSRNGMVLKLGDEGRLTAAPLAEGGQLFLGNSRLEVLRVEGLSLDLTVPESSGPTWAGEQDPDVTMPEPIAPAPAPAPTPAQAPVSAPPIERNRNHDSVELDSSVIDKTRMPEAEVDGIAARDFIDRAAPRLLLFDETGHRAERLSELPALIGRRSGDINIDRQQVSSKHARIAFRSGVAGGCTVEDLGSSNRTFVGHCAISPNAPVTLEPDTLLLFGPAEAVYRAGLRPNGDEVGPASDEAVALRLVSAGRFSSGQLSSVRKEARSGQALGDVILLNGLVEPSIWCEVAAQVRLAPPAPSGGRGKRVLLLAAAAMAVVLGLLFALGVIDRGALGL